MIMDELLHDIKADVKEIKADVKAINETLSKNTASLIVHEHRTTLAEHRIEKFENGVKWMLGLIATGVISAVLKLLAPHI